MAAYVIIFILQGTQDIDNVAQSAMLPELVSKEELIEANSMFQMLGSAAMFVGPGLGAVLYKACGAGLLYLIDSMTFVFAAVMMALVLKRRLYQQALPEIFLLLFVKTVFFLLYSLASLLSLHGVILSEGSVA